MNQETKLRLQAYLDNELSDSEAPEIAALVERDSEARALSAALREVKALLQDNEPEFKLPESREFFWSKIERSIRQEEAVEKPGNSSAHQQSWWMRFFAPATGVAVLLVTAISLVRLVNAPSDLTYLHEIETPLEDTSAMSFYSASAGMTVVWVQSRVY